MMGQYHLTVNLTKKEFIHPHHLGDGLKLMEQAGSSEGTGAALLLLLAASNGRGGGDAEAHPLIGSWAGDRIAVVGDYADDADFATGIEGIGAGQVYAACLDGVFKDISHGIGEVLEKEFGFKLAGEGWLTRDYSF